MTTFPSAGASNSPLTGLKWFDCEGRWKSEISVRHTNLVYTRTRWRHLWPLKALEGFFIDILRSFIHLFFVFWMHRDENGVLGWQDFWWVLCFVSNSAFHRVMQRGAYFPNIHITVCFHRLKGFLGQPMIEFLWSLPWSFDITGHFVGMLFSTWCPDQSTRWTTCVCIYNTHKYH
jgi:hypothetical protein